MSVVGGLQSNVLEGRGSLKIVFGGFVCDCTRGEKNYQGNLSPQRDNSNSIDGGKKFVEILDQLNRVRVSDLSKC